ncbi:MAG: chromosomal replication initiator protein DnaA [Candidatus Omnitrophica bacterium CG11_big_fil_rev_8_21_14_0_20_45_26]|uniref:Chromosomal replication initiator protein DnaA n=1 Tax=Candidatus Abzuiibacterium crystallinum TaxID=1974748 RepID=A0A2H0LNG6_9BACT|nr:MAG: chromosomal replication initiator protein DnaA [Candidatus Omnitrophica bacterium CG11_big_fil_rev_8_21_14_0_20_45_26]PIW64729.1 MAG: chromosomal replication initiator protein DnaA [Candidatus Omnitrophica bacterium CG12_big_fil_rev_8_21_14_0_65_45_16]
MSEQLSQASVSQISGVWQKISLRVREELSDQSYNTWFSTMVCVAIGDHSLTLTVPDKFYGDWIKEHYETVIQSAAQEILGFRPTISYEVVTPKETGISFPPSATQRLPMPASDVPKEITLNQRYSFDNFVVGSGNRFAHAASLAVSENLARKYNPLFIYGGVGLGKTHLIQSIACRVLEKNANAKVVYISSEKFTTQLISAIQSRSTTSFRERYRAADLLLIDDIHFIAGKESTQEEFFHTFNTLYDAHKQIVVTSDRPPKDIPGLEERLVSRFGWGLVADIQPPDFETRVAILRKKLDQQKTSIPDDILFLIADKISSNIRELEGALVRVVAYASLTNSDLNTTLVKDVLKDAFKEEELKVTIDHIQRCVSEYYGVKVSDLRAKKRNSSVVLPRQVAMFLARQLTSHSLPEVGDYFGGRGHATVLHGVNKIKVKLKSDPKLQQAVEFLLRAVKK